MNVKELIVNLTKLESEHGDIPVAIGDADTGLLLNIKYIEIKFTRPRNGSIKFITLSGEYGEDGEPGYPAKNDDINKGV